MLNLHAVSSSDAYHSLFLVGSTIFGSDDARHDNLIVTLDSKSYDVWRGYQPFATPIRFVLCSLYGMPWDPWGVDHPPSPAGRV